jgi:hypothetical protein
MFGPYTEFVFRTMRTMLFCVSSILGGVGMVYLWESFRHPEVAGLAILYILVATAIHYGPIWRLK